MPLQRGASNALRSIRLDIDGEVRRLESLKGYSLNGEELLEQCTGILKNILEESKNDYQIATIVSTNLRPAKREDDVGEH